MLFPKSFPLILVQYYSEFALSHNDLENVFPMHFGDFKTAVGPPTDIGAMGLVEKQLLLSGIMGKFIP